MVGWSADALTARQAHPNIDYLLPDDGVLLWGDSFVISAASQQKILAEAFIDFMLLPKYAAMVANDLYYATTNEAAMPLIDVEIIQGGIVFPTIDQILAAEWYAPLSPEATSLWEATWQRFEARIP
jgi:spermidine/putrescine transport system substrate-binding protein